MATYLLTWNPDDWPWDDLQANVEDLAQHGSHLGRWSTGVSNKIQPKDRLFLIRLGREPKGIIGSGWAKSKVYKAPHRHEKGKVAKYVDVDYDVLINPELNPRHVLPRKKLNNLGKMHWDSQSSGTTIPEGVARRLEELWAKFLDNGNQITLAAEPCAIEGLQTEIVSYRRGRSRQLRDLALKKSEGICCVCDEDFSKLLGGKGKRVLQVHHRRQLAITRAPRLTRLSELAVVCANCHMLIHLNPKRAIRIYVLKKMLRASSKV